MLPFNFIICSNQIGSGNIGKVYKIKDVINPQNILIAKIYDPSKIQIYENEKNILSKFSEFNNNKKDYLIKLKDEQVILEHSEDFQINSKLLVFDYLIHGKLCDYLYIMPNTNHFKENHLKILCYKLLQGLKKCHENNILHNRIDLKNIMLDNDFNPVIIHFRDALIINNNNFNKDFFALGIVLAKLVTAGKFKTIGLDKKRNKYFIKCNFSNTFQKNIFEESIFWRTLENLYKIQISVEFKKFFEILTKPKNLININDLLNNEWLKDINNNLNEFEDDYKKQMKNIYDKILYSQNIDKYQIDISSILYQTKEIKNNLIEECYTKSKLESFDDEDNKKGRKDSDSSENERKKSPDFKHDYKKVLSIRNKKKKKSPSFEDDYNEGSYKRKKSKESSRFEGLIDYNDIDENIKYFEKEDNIFKIKEYNEKEKFESYDYRKYYAEEDNNKYSYDKDFIYYNENIIIRTIQTEPKGIDFNYIEIDINGNDYYYKKILANYMSNLEINIKEFHYEKKVDINSEFSNINLEFKISFENISFEKEDNLDEKIEYLDDDNNISDLIPLIIKIELFKLEQKGYNNRYYLMINHIQGDMAGFYEYLIIIKMIATKLLNYLSKA